MFKIKKAAWLAAIVCSFLSSSLFASTDLDRYLALREMRPDDRQVAVENWQITNDLLQFGFEQEAFRLMNSLDGKMDRFFEHWVEGYEMSHYSVDVQITKTGGSHRILGSFTQDNVSDQFMAMVPFYINFGKGRSQ